MVDIIILHLLVEDRVEMTPESAQEWKMDSTEQVGGGVILKFALCIQRYLWSSYFEPSYDSCFIDHT